ncbi:CUB domain-containing protein [Flavobacterium sp.]|uniref:CUB domain-containing protein n=1 Tax=Flavobacterium sp. TaxID=239 RepID=UPI00286CFFCA|nr:CUB domain-containing protein [Flavobacterium sp.]
MKKISLFILALLLFSINGYSQFTEGFENTTGPDAFPSTNWTLDSGNWAVFDNGIGTQRWGINSTISTPPTVYQGANAAYITRDNIGQGNTSENYLATPPIQVPTNGELHFFTRMFTSGNQGAIYQIKVASVTTGSQTNPNDYILVQQWSEDELITPTSNFNIYTEKTVDLSAFAGQFVYISFVKVYTQPTTSIDGDRWLIDSVGVNARCLSPTGLTFSAITVDGATLNWINPNGAGTTWEIEIVLASGTPTGIPTHTTTTLPFVVTGLLPNTAYKYYVRAICASGFSSAWSTASANFITGTAPPICGGNFVDSGGVGGNYANNENSTTTICPTTPGDQVTVTFTSFNTQNATDFLRVYDGNNASAPLLATLSGTALPPAFTSSASSGCLTFVFTSNGTTTAAGWASNVTCAPAPTCSIPNTVTNSIVTSSSAVISWTQPANPDSSVATAWQVLALPCGSAAPTAGSTGFVNATSNPFTLNGLTSTTCYDIYVRAVCSASDSSAWSRITTSFTTQAAPPVCGGNFVDSGSTTGSYSNNENITTTICPTNAGDLVTVTFTSFSMESCCDRLRIYDGSTAAAPLLGTYTGTTLPPTYTSSAANGCLTFVFTSDSSVVQTGWIANVTCAPAPTCSRPTALTNTTVLSTSAILSWTQPSNPDSSVATAWQVLALPCGSAAPTAASTGFVNASTNPFTLTGLTPLTCYDVYVRAVCSASDSSAWSTVTTFTTQALPPVCGGNFVDTGGPTGNYNNNANITTTICPINSGDLVTVTFTSFSLETGSDQLRIYDGDNASAPLLGTYSGNVIPPTYTSNAASGCLTFVFTSDSSVTQAGWTSNVTCAPAPLCRKPINLTTSAVSANSVNLAWTNIGNATSWEVLALPCGSAVPTAATTGWVPASTNPFALTGLFPNTCYTIYVRGNCGTDGVSDWSSSVTITTQIAPPVCGGNFLDSGVLGNYANNSNIATLICPSSLTDKVTVTFTSFDTELNNDILRIYNGNSASAPLIGTYSGTILPPSATSSAANGCLYFVFISNSTVNQTGWSSNITCAPAASCPKPLGVTASTVVTTTSQLSWIEAGSATSWQVLILPCGSPSPTNSTPGWVSTTSNPYTLTGLTPNCCNQYYVRSVCSGSETSNWTPAYQNQAGSYVVWNSASDASTLTGTYPGGTVTLTFTGTGNIVTIDSPATTATNLVVTGSNTFSTNGPSDTPPSRRLTFTFSTPVIIDRYSMADIDISTWDDSFNFVGVTFTSTTSTGVNASVTGAVAISPSGDNNAYASWFGSTTTVTSFSLDYLTTGGLTHAYLAYALKVFTPCPIPLATLNVSVNSPTVCQGTPANVFATPSIPGTYNYSWTIPSGATNPGNVASFFTNVAGIYSVIITNTTTGATSSSTSGTVTINTPVTPNFISPAPICSGTTAPTLPLTSLNGIAGTWSPSVVSNTLSGTYTFTPNTPQCAETVTLAVTVYQDCSFGSFASAVWLTNCEDNNFFNTVGSGTSIIGPAQNIFPDTDFGTYISNSNTFKLRGAEVKTFKSVTANVCSARLNYRIYPQAGTPGAFTVLNLPFFDNCSGSTFPSGGPCNPGDQKWQEVLSDTEFPVDLTAFPAGDYVLEVFYDITGDVDSTTQCDDTIYINNNGDNFIATYRLQNTPGYFGTNPTTCNGTDGSILITNLASNTQYNLSYDDDGIPVSTIITSTSNGDYTISGLNAGDYNTILVYANNCLISSGSISLFNPIITPIFDPISPICRGQALSPLPTTSNEGITGTWLPALDNTTTTTYTFTPNSSGSSSTNLIVNGDFSSGNTGFTTDYQYLNNAGLSGVQKAYGIVTAANLWFQFFPACTGHTPTSGNMMVVDGSTVNAGNDKVWGQTVAVVPNQTYTFSYWLQTVATPNLATIEVTINGTSIGAVTAPTTNCQWAQISYTWNSGTNTSAQIAIYDRIILSNGNDFSLDDISFGENITNQCATSTSLTITVNQPIAATFNTIPAICSGGIAPTLPVTSIEGFTGTWSPSIVDNAQTLTYTFIPTAGQCASQGSVVVTVNQNTIPTFAIGTSITSCAGFSLQVLLPTTSQNGITGTWNPSTLDYSIVGTTVYTFTPTLGLCATTTTLTAVINPNVTPTFTQVLPICSGGQLNTLPTSSIEGISGTWLPALNNLATTVYTFTPTIGLCAVTNTMTIVVNPIITPTFNAIAPLCTGEIPPSLPTSSLEAISGTWTPAVIDNTTSGTYTFVPTAGQCANNGSLALTVQSAFDFELSGKCIENDFIIEVTALNNTIDLTIASFVWSNSNGQAVGNNSSTFNVTEYLNSTTVIEEMPITFSVTVTNSEGCYKTESITQERIFCGIQKGISVNNDGDNEFFDLSLLNVKHLSIFNRYGMKVYSKGGYTNEWKGQSDKGDELPDGTYYYVIDFKDNLPAKTGWIYINRAH